MTENAKRKQGGHNEHAISDTLDYCPCSTVRIKFKKNCGMGMNPCREMNNF